MELNTIQKIAVWAIPLIFAVTLHEVAHGYVALLCGDRTAKLLGRLTLNPIKHIDPVGTVLLPLLMLMVSNFIFGWAKPVPTDPRHFRHPRRDMALVSLSGPLANLLMALAWGLIAKLGILADMHGNAWFGIPLTYMGGAGIMINVVLAILNLIPIPPLDGGKFVASLLPPRLAYEYNKIEPYGAFIIIALLLLGILSTIMQPFIYYLINFIEALFHLP